ncbi:MAG: hypothetical protein EOP49_30905, partial [Sphingobacteriales bacterium]
MKNITLLIPMLLFSIGSFCQNKHGNIWVNGALKYFKTDFGTNPPINMVLQTNSNILFDHGHSNICDSAGNLILMSNGLNIYKSNGDTIDGGYRVTDSIFHDLGSPGLGYAQESLFLPLGNDKYFFVNPIPSDSLFAELLANPSLPIGWRDILYCSIVDMKANGGAGKVVKKKVKLLSGVKMAYTQMMACRHGDGKSWWLLKQAHDTNMVYKFLITEDTVYGPYLQGFADPHFGIFHNGGQSVFTLDGTKYATTARGAGKVFVADFDRCSGMLSNPQTYVVPAPAIYYADGSFAGHDETTESAAFSPNGRFLYVGKYNAIVQLDLQAANPAIAWDTIAKLDTTWAQFTEYSTMYLGPNGRLYIGNWHGTSSEMSVINEPNKKGALADFCPRCLSFPSLNGVSVTAPPNMANYLLGPTNPPCTVGLNDAVANELKVEIYPNPTTGRIWIKYEMPQTSDTWLHITDMHGKQVWKGKL